MCFGFGSPKSLSCHPAGLSSSMPCPGIRRLLWVPWSPALLSHGAVAPRPSQALPSVSSWLPAFCLASLHPCQSCHPERGRVKGTSSRRSHSLSPRQGCLLRVPWMLLCSTLRLALSSMAAPPHHLVGWSPLPWLLPASPPQWPAHRAGGASSLPYALWASTAS